MENSYILYILIGVIVVLTAFVIRLELRLKKLLRGDSVKDLEEAILSALKDLERLDISKKNIEKEIQKIKERLKKNVQTVGTVRFNPFKDVGGNQSFASAFIDENGDGVVLSTLFSREKVSVFAKPLKNNQSEYELSGEEKEALRRTVEKR